MASELSAISGGWVALDDRLFSINVFLYVSPATAPEPSREGYQQIRRAIGAQVGPPAAEDPVTKAGAACLWRNQEVGIELYHHTYPESLVQVGISRLEINTEYEVLVATGNTTG